MCDFPGATRSLKPLRKIGDLDLMFDAHVSDRHPHYAKSFFDTFYPFVFAQCGQHLSDGLDQ
jgi:hypothetical protein